MTDRTMTQNPSVTERGYVNPDLLVSTEWVANHLDEGWIRIVESDEDVLLYDIGHVPGAVKIDWHEDLQDPTVRDFIGSEKFASLMERFGIDNDTTVIFYGDKNNWWAAYAYWFFAYMGHTNMRIMDGGRKKWEAEGRPLTREVPNYPHTSYSARPMRSDLRAFRSDVLDHIGYKDRQKVGDGKPLVDVRSPGEYSGELLHMADYPQEGALRGGHIPGAKSIPWGKAVNDDGTFKAGDELRELYGSQGVTSDKDIVTYCRIGERSAHTWFVLHELLGYPSVRNYDGSWTEWGNVIGVPIER
ncbi:MAG: sulfurtransferase [Nitrolancea sp.]